MMGRLALGVAAWSFGLLASAAPAAAPLPLAESVERFGSRESAFAADLSPDGSKIVYLAAGPDSMTAAVVQDVASGAKKFITKSSGKPEILRACYFVTSDTLICSFSGNIHYTSIIIGMSRHVLIDLATGKVRSLAVREEPVRSALNQFDGRVIDWLPDEQGAVLMQRNYADMENSLGVDRISVAPFKATRVETPKADYDFYLTDGHGAVRFAGGREKDLNGALTEKINYRYRVAASRDWLKLTGMGDDFAPLLVEKSTDSLYFFDTLDGRRALYRMKLDGSNRRELVAKHSAVDIDGPVRLYPGDPVIGYRYTDDRSHTVYTDPEWQALAQRLGKAIPESPLIDIVSMSRDRKKLLIYASGDTDAGAFYVLNRTTREMTAVALAREELEQVSLAKVLPVSVPTRDGVRIPAYVTGPAESQKGPVVIMPHGGPASRDEWGFDWLAQFLAERGYTVVQPNFRGSAGYGEAFLGDNAFKGWRTAMNDIQDTADWAVKSGLADPSRMAVVGWSYGGYAALMSAAIDPRYRAVVAIAPVTDLGALRRDAEGFSDAELAKAEIGKGPHLKEGSPVSRAAAIKAPVLLVHGTLDSNVRVAHSQRMNRALKRDGGTVDYLEFKDLDHQIDSSDARKEMLRRIAELLDRQIGH